MFDSVYYIVGKPPPFTGEGDRFSGGRGKDQLRSYVESTKRHAKALRKNQTPEECHLWYDFLASFHIRFRRQYIVGNYIIDFYCPSLHLAVDLDGSQHYEPEGISHDFQRTCYLKKRGIDVIRFTNADVKGNFVGVCEMIEKEVLRRGGPLPPS